MLTVKEVFQLTNRGVEGFVSSLFRMMKIDLFVPDHSTFIETRQGVEGKSAEENQPKLEYCHG
jgi:hypothetical protein